MLQEFVGERLKSRCQVVFKWERGESKAGMFNFITLTKSYGVSVEEILHYDHIGIAKEPDQ